jgi:mRNA interferase RelE/StbE
MNYRIIYTDVAREDLDRLPQRQAAQIVKKIARLQHGLHGDIKRLQNHDHAYRLRMGDFRILFDIVKDAIVIQRIKDRKDAYS